jgi:dienelactone hydrolase
MTKPRYCVLPLTLLLQSGVLLAQESYWLGDARGPYQTGTYTDMWMDESRGELTTTDPDDKRKVMVQIWYPASPDAGEEYAPYVFDLELFQDYLQEWGAELGSSPTRSVLNADVHADGPFPVLLYSHGGNSPHFSGTAQTEFLASHGYIVVSVAHTDDSAVVRFPDGEEYQGTQIQQMPGEQERAGWSQLEIYRWQKEHLQDLHGWHVKDLVFTLNQLEGLNGTTSSHFYQDLDLQRVGAFGWSRGGATSFQATVEDERIKAAANLDGTIYGRSIESSGSDNPLLLLEGTNSYFDPLNDREADPEIEELWSSVESDLWHMFARSTSDWYRAKVVGTTHTQFSDFPLANPQPPEEFIKPQRVRDITNAMLLEFFDKYLRNAAESPLLSGEDIYPELHVVTAVKK